MCTRLASLLLLACVALAAVADARRLQQEEAVAIAGAGAPDELSAPAPAADAPAPGPDEWEDAAPPTPSPEPSPSPEDSPSPSPEAEEPPSPPSEDEEESPSPEPEPSPSPPSPEPEPAEGGEGREERRDAMPTYTVGPAPPAKGFEPIPVPGQYAGTCDLNPSRDLPLGRCEDGFGDVGDGTEASDFLLMWDPAMMDSCGIAPIDDIILPLVEEAYSGKYGGCGITAYTITRVCVGQGSAEGQWRTRVLLWPDSPDCEPLCIKMRGSGSQAGTYGRTATC